MKLKYVLFSGLLLSVGFTACTNEDFTEAISPVSTDGIALDEVTLNVGNGADTKAALGSDYKPTWDEGDLLGAARFHQITKYDEEKGVTAVATGLDAFKANHTLELTEGKGTNNGIFTTQDSRGLEAGAHVLYYPQRKDITPVGTDKLSVKINSETIDCAEPLKNVSDNMFAYSAVKFVPEQDDIRDYTLKQVPVLYNLYFTPDFHHTQALAEPITIKHIVVEAWNGTTPVTTELGKVVAKGAVPSAADYNNNDLGKYIEYTNDVEGAVDHLFYNVENSNNTDYQLVKNEVRTVKAFQFSALPWSDEADFVIIKVVTDKGTFTKTYDSATENEAGKKPLDMFNAQATAEGGVVSLNVVLDTTEEDEVIYTADQMRDVLKNIKKGEIYHWIMGEPIEVDDAELNVAENAKIYISRYPLTVKSLNATNGEIVVLNDLIVKGDALIGSNSKGFETVATASIEQEDGTTRTATGDGNLSVDGKLTIAGGKYAPNNKITIKLAKAGSLQVDASGIVDITGIMDGTDYVTEIGDINNEVGELTLNQISIAEGKKVDNTGKLTVGAGVENNGTINQDGEFIMNADFTNKGEFNINDTMNGNGETFVNAAGAELNVNAAVTMAMSQDNIIIENAGEDTTKKLPTAVINVHDGGSLTPYTGRTLTNDGIINIEKGGVISEGGENTLVQAGADAEINVADDATAVLTLNSTATGVKGGYIFPGQHATINNSNVNVRVAANITANSDLAKINPYVRWYLISGNITFDNTTDNKFKTNSLVFLGGNTVTLEDGVTFTKTSGRVEFDGNVKLVNSVTDGTAAGAIFELQGGYNMVKAGTLTVGEDVELGGNATLTIKVGANLDTTEGAQGTQLTIENENYD